MDSIDRQVREAAHGPDHQFMQAMWRTIVSDTTTGSGYAYLDEHGRVALLAATNRRTASRLLWAAIADGGTEQRITHVTTANEWAHRHRHRGPARAPHQRLPCAARDETADAVRSQRCPALDGTAGE